MKTSTPCPNCGKSLTSSTCNSCGSVLALHLSDLQILREEVLKFQSELSEKSQNFLKRISSLEKSLPAAAPEKVISPEVDLIEKKAPDIIAPKSEAPTPKSSAENSSPVQPLPVPIPVPLPKTQKSPLNSPYSKQPKTHLETTNSRKASTAPSSVKEKEELPFILSLILSPLQLGFNYAKGVFSHYKEAGRLPVFFLSLGGIIAMLFGVGYLMQLGINYFIEILSPATLEGMKIGFAMLTASTILVLGIRFSKKDAKYRDFSAALLGLGIAVFYLIFYFLPESVHFPIFKEPFLSLSLIAITAFFGSWLALKYETRVLAVVSFLGAALIPLFMNAQILGELYLGFLGFLSLSALYTARQISWKPLRMICLVVVLGVIEWMVYASGNRLSTPALIVALHGFAYMFIINTLWRKSGMLKAFKTEDIFMISSTLSLLILNSLTLSSQHGLDILIGWLFVANAAVWAIFCAISFQQISASLRWLCFLISGAFLALAAFLLLDQNYLAMGLGIEALLLLTFGYKFALPRVRLEAYALGTFVLGRCLYGMRNFVEHWQIGLWSDSFMHLLILGGVLAGTLFLVRKFSTNDWEKQLQYVLSESLFIWTIGTLLLVVSKYLGIYTYNFALLPMVFMMYWGNKHQLVFGERLGWLLGLSFVISYMISVENVGNFHFFAQSWPAKIALLEAFGMLWLLQFLYKKWDKDSTQYEAAVILRRTFFVLLPLVYLPSVSRRFPEFLPYAAWFSVMFAYVLARYRQRIELVVETHGLVLLATVLMFFPLTIPSVLTGVMVLGIMYGADEAHLWKKYRKSPFKIIHTYSFWFLALAFSLGILEVDTDLAQLCPALLALYFLSLYVFKSRIAPLRKHATLLYRFFMVWALACMSILYFIFKGGFLNLGGVDVAFMVLVAMMLGLAQSYWKNMFKYLGQKDKYRLILQARFIFIHAMIFLCYAATWTQLTGNSMGMGFTLSMFVHAILLLFFSSKKQRGWIQKLAFMLLALAFSKLILLDFRNFDLAYKVGVSILSGALMLLGARLYLKQQAVNP